MLNFLEYFINRYLPSIEICTDPLRGVKSRYSAIPIDKMRVPIMTRRNILSLRPQIPEEIQFEDGERLAVIVPYRDREHHLIEFVPALKKALFEQGVDFKIVVVEQAQGQPFNRGKLKNIGAHYVFQDCDYFCFHDVDMLPIKANYLCPSSPLRLIKKFETTWRAAKELCDTNFGGVVMLNKENYLSCNGYSNQYWGWGKEDDDFFIRLIMKGLVPFEDNEGVYLELPNPEDQVRRHPATLKKNKKTRRRLLRNSRLLNSDGFSNIDYRVVSETVTPDYLKIKVEI